MSLAQNPAPVNPPKNNVVPFPVLPLAAGFAVRDSLRRLDAFAKAVLYSLAMRMPNCWPSVETVARDSGMKVRKAQEVLAKLEREGVVRRTRQEGRYGTNVYELDLGALREGCTIGVQGCTSCGAEGCTTCTQRGNRGKRQDQKRADAGVEDREERAPDRPRTLPQSTPVVAPSAPAVCGQRDVGDPVPCTPPSVPPESGRVELPDVSVREPAAAVDREVEAMRVRGERDGEKAMVTEPEHLAAAFDACHENVYGFPSPELRGPKLWRCAVSAARRLTEEVFGGDAVEAAKYVVWAWEREKRARKAGKDRDRPIGWRLMFGPMVTDYLKFLADRTARRSA